MGFPLPRGARVLNEQHDPRENGHAIELVLRTSDLDSVHTFYQETLPAEWEWCRANRADWDNVGDRRERRSWWADAQKRSFLVLETIRVPRDKKREESESPDVILRYVTDMPAWDLYYKGVCVRRETTYLTPWDVYRFERHCRASDRESFDAETWRASNAEARGRMIDDLLCRGLLFGLGSDEVVELLGPPDSRDEAVFSYRVSRPGSHERRFVPPAPDHLRCEEDLVDLEFDFSVRTPVHRFGLNEACEEIGV